jgi:hypothetical protein
MIKTRQKELINNRKVKRRGRPNRGMKTEVASRAPKKEPIRSREYPKP